MINFTFFQINLPIVPSQLSPLQSITFARVISFIVQVIFFVAFVTAFLFLAVGGIRFILSQGDEKAIAQARSAITFAIVGFVVVLIAFGIVRFIEFIFNISIITPTGQVPLPGGVL